MLRIEPLSRSHERNAFDCGEPSLNGYLQKTARQHIEKGISKTFVLVDIAQPTHILGFYTLAACEVIANRLPDKYAKKYPEKAPAAKLARLAVSENRQREGLGAIMMADAMKRILAVSENIGVIGFFVDAKHQNAREYYEQFSFIQLPDHPLHLFLPLSSLQAAMEAVE